MKTQWVFFSQNRQWALFRGAVRGVLTKLLFQKAKRSAFRTWGQGESLLLLHLEEPAISIQPASLAYPSAFVSLLSLFFLSFPPCGKQFVAQVRLLLERIAIPRALCVAPSCWIRKKKQNKKLSNSWMYMLSIPTQTRIQIIKDHPHQYTWATGILAGITSCWPLASVTGTAGERSRLTH